MKKIFLLVVLLLSVCSTANAVISFDGDGRYQWLGDCPEFEAVVSSAGTDMGCDTDLQATYILPSGTGLKVTSSSDYTGAGSLSYRGVRQTVLGNYPSQTQPSATGSLALIFADYNTHQYQEIWIRFYIRYETGFFWAVGDTNGHKLLYTKDQYLTNLPYLDMSAGGLRWAVNGGNSGRSVKTWADLMGGDISDGSWHCIEWHIKSETVTQAPFDGVMQIWIDGVLEDESLTENLFIFSNTRYFRGSAILQNFHYMGFTGEMWVDMNEIVIYNTTPPNTDTLGNPYIGPLATSTAPVVNAGIDQNITVDSATIAGTYTLEPARTVSTCTWSNNRGGSGSLTATGGVISGTVTGLSEGVNIITVTITDSAAETGNDPMQITYTPPGGGSTASLKGGVPSGGSLR